LIGGILRLVVIDIFAHLDQKDRAYFRETREQRLGAKLETISADRETNVLAFRKTLEPIRTVIAAPQPYLGGKMPAYADYAVFGCFQWARCISSFPLLLEDDPISTWRRGARLVITGCYPHSTDLPAKRLDIPYDAQIVSDERERHSPTRSHTTTYY
jgi:glutathione S-transferase